MPTYSGFSTQNACSPLSTNNQISDLTNPYGLPTGLTSLTFGNKFKLFDYKLVLQDFINALSIPLGSKVGQPGYGTTLYTFIFEPNTVEIQTALENEIRRVAAQDPRIQLGIVKAFPQNNGVLLEVEISIAPFNNPTTQAIYFSQQTNRATAV